MLSYELVYFVFTLMFLYFEVLKQMYIVHFTKIVMDFVASCSRVVWKTTNCHYDFIGLFLQTFGKQNIHEK